MKYQLTPGYELSIDIYKEKIRLIIFKDGEQFVCRSDSRGNILFFLTFKNNHLFKGRLQLEKDHSTITVFVKNKIIGCMHEEDFIQLMP